MQFSKFTWIRFTGTSNTAATSSLSLPSPSPLLLSAVACLCPPLAQICSHQWSHPLFSLCLLLSLLRVAKVTGGSVPSNSLFPGSSIQSALTLDLKLCCLFFSFHWWEEASTLDPRFWVSFWSFSEQYTLTASCIQPENAWILWHF
jgi:hypothetical protein